MTYCLLLLALAQEEDPAAWFQRMERALLESETLRIRARTTGALETCLDLMYASPNRVAGTLELGFKIEFRCDGQTFATSVDGNQLRLEAPEEFGFRSLKVLARFGAFAGTMTALNPAHASFELPEPEAPTWRGVEEVEVAGGERRTAVGISYTIRRPRPLGGSDALDVRLWLDPDTGFPVRREIERPEWTEPLIEVIEQIERNVPVDESLFVVPEDWGRPPRVENHPFLPGLRAVSLALDGRPVAEAISEIARQTGWTMGPLPPADETLVTVALENVPALAALDEICRQAEIAYQSTAGFLRGGHLDTGFEPDSDHDIVFRSGPLPTGRVVYPGPFSLRLVRVERSAVVDFTTAEPRREMRLFLQVRLQPGTMLMGLGIRALSAMDDAGKTLHALELATADVTSRALGETGATWEPSVALSVPGREARRIVRLEGSLEAYVPRWYGVEEFAPSAGAQERDVGEATLRIEGFDAEAAELSLSVLFRSRGTEEPGEPNLLLTVRDAHGRAWEWGALRSSREGHEYVETFQLRRGEAGPVAQVVVQYEAGNSRVVFPFVLENIPLEADR